MPAPPLRRTVIDPIETINRSIAQAWQALSKTYSVTASQPGITDVFQGADLEYPDQAAEVVLVNMLLEVIESISRFSPWYRMPARTFGLVSMRDPSSGRQRWMLAPEGCQRYAHLLNPIMDAIDSQRGVLRGILLIEGGMETYLNNDPQVILECGCDPPHAIQVRRSVREKSEIICDDCRKPYI
jgi:hypothetical protein